MFDFSSPTFKGVSKSIARSSFDGGHHAPHELKIYVGLSSRFLTMGVSNKDEAGVLHAPQGAATLCEGRVRSRNCRTEHMATISRSRVRSRLALARSGRPMVLRRPPRGLEAARFTRRQEVVVAEQRQRRLVPRMIFSLPLWHVREWVIYL